MHESQALNSVLEAVGGTPMVRLRRLPAETGAALYAKCEQLEPGGSVKDRIALSMIEAAEAQGLLGPGGTVIEPTSGNTGVGLALACAAKGYRCVLTLPADMSLERRQLLERFGAEVVLTDPEAFMEGAIAAARDLAEKTPGAFIPSQFDNPANVAAHRDTTGPELVESLEALGEVPRLDALVLGVGTGGTLSGAAPVVKARFPGAKIIAVEPARSPVLGGGEAGLHRIQGLGAGFVPPILERALIDEVIAVSDEEAWACARRLAREEGLLVGISAGAATFAALEIAARLPPEAVVATLLPDTGERYFSVARFFEGGEG